MPDLFGALPDPSLDPALSPYERVEALIPEDHPLHGMDSLDEIYAWLASTVLVPIDEARIKPVLGTGDPHADLMIVGEAPGADEDKSGEPFVGRAGQLLNKILEAVLFEREEVYITNILKSRPPNNRDPEAAEVAAHIPILHKQIALVKPKMILAVGKSAGNGLLGQVVVARFAARQVQRLLRHPAHGDVPPGGAAPKPELEAADVGGHEAAPHALRRAVWRSAHRGHRLACPTIPNSDPSTSKRAAATFP